MCLFLLSRCHDVSGPCCHDELLPVPESVVPPAGLRVEVVAADVGERDQGEELDGQVEQRVGLGGGDADEEG